MWMCPKGVLEQAAMGVQPGHNRAMAQTRGGLGAAWPLRAMRDKGVHKLKVTRRWRRRQRRCSTSHSISSLIRYLRSGGT
jgi:hypothetical protein